jgi:hypothetical protein
MSNNPDQNKRVLASGRQYRSYGQGDPFMSGEEMLQGHPPSLPIPDPSAVTMRGGEQEEEQNVVKLKFPRKLHYVLEIATKAGLDHILSWQPNGYHFVIHDRPKFIALILPKYFSNIKYKSFLKQLNLYKFSRLTHGAHRGAYYHPCMVRGDPDLCDEINRQADNVTTQDTSSDTASLTTRNILQLDEHEEATTTRSHFASLMDFHSPPHEDLHHIDLAQLKRDSDQSKSNSNNQVSDLDVIAMSTEPTKLEELLRRSIMNIPMTQTIPSDIAQEIIGLFGSSSTSPDRSSKKRKAK